MTKAELRREARTKLRAMPAEARRSASARIAAAIWTLPAVADAGTLLLYASTPEEVDTDAIAAEAARRGISVVYPRCVLETRRLHLHRVDGDGPGLRAGAYGLREPDPDRCPEVEVAQVDAALVPGLAWDRTGRRLGRGAGYYDRLFARADWRGYRCGLFYALQEFLAVPSDAWDAPLDAVVTEHEVWTRPAGDAAARR